MLGVRDHPVDPPTGRPQLHASWPVEHFGIGAGFAFAIAYFALAVHVYARSNETGLALGVAGIGGLHVLAALFRRAALGRKERRYREAVADYEATLTRIARRED